MILFIHALSLLLFKVNFKLQENFISDDKVTVFVKGVFTNPISVLDIENFLYMSPLLICRHSIDLAGANEQRVFR